MFISYDEATLYQLSRIDSLQTDRQTVYFSFLFNCFSQVYPIFQVYEASWSVICSSILLNTTCDMELFAYFKVTWYYQYQSAPSKFSFTDTENFHGSKGS